MTKYDTQADFARYRDVSASLVSRWIKTGKIPASCIKTISGKRLIDRDKANKALSENLDRIYNPRHEHEPTTLEIQSHAADYAFLSDESGLNQPEWELRYLVKMLELDTDHVEIEKIDQTHYLIKVLDIDDVGEPCPWGMEVKLRFGGVE